MGEGSDSIWRNDSVRDALESGDVAAIVRAIRRARQLTLAELGARCGYSPSTISRIETGRQPLRDVEVLRLLAGALDVPAQLLGVADTPAWNPTAIHRPARLAATQPPNEENDPMRRRTLLVGLTGLAGSSLLPPSTRSDPVAALERVLLRAPAAPATRPAATILASQVTAARSMFQLGRYSEVADALPGLLRTAIATADRTPAGQATAHLAELYTLSTELMIKLGHDHLAWTTADRALQAAYASDDVLVVAAARRAWGMALRRAGRAETANRLVLDTAATLQPELRRGPEHMSMYGSLLATASYTAASDGDRDTAHSLITEAAQIAHRVGDTAAGLTQPALFTPIGVDLYRISIARALGDPGTAIDIARRVDPAAIPTVERLGQYWTDVARSFHQWGKTEHCYRALLVARHAVSTR